MKVILSSNPYRDRGLKAALEAQRILERSGAQTALCLPFVPKKGDRVDVPRQLTLSSLERELPSADLLICLGGDGTILHAARDATLHDVPILGVNMGSVGFMAELERSELPLLAPLAQGNFSIEERMMLDVQVVRGGKIISQDLALNDAVVFKGSMARVAEVEVWADQVQVSSIMGDGVIVATPTGSTAYSMSAGGPIVEPTSRSIIITPVCAHQLAARAMVLSPERTVSVTLPRGTTQATISRDIKELRLVKVLTGKGAYRYAPSERKGAVTSDTRLRNIFKEGVISVDVAQNIVVVKTMPGLASAACSALDNMEIPGIVGSLAGDHTGILIMRDSAAAQSFNSEVHKLLK